MCRYRDIKKKEAPLACKNRRVPIPLSPVRFITVVKDMRALPLYCIASAIPVITCTPRHIRRRDPKFHHQEIDLGTGRVIREPRTTLKRESFFIVDICYF